MGKLALFAIVEGLGFVLLVLWLAGRKPDATAGSIPLLIGAIVCIVVGNIGVLTWVLGQVKRNGRIRAGL